MKAKQPILPHTQVIHQFSVDFITSLLIRTCLLGQDREDLYYKLVYPLNSCAEKRVGCPLVLWPHLYLPISFAYFCFSKHLYLSPFLICSLLSALSLFLILFANPFPQHPSTLPLCPCSIYNIRRGL